MAPWAALAVPTGMPPEHEALGLAATLKAIPTLNEASMLHEAWEPLLERLLKGNEESPYGSGLRT